MVAVVPKATWPFRPYVPVLLEWLEDARIPSNQLEIWRAFAAFIEAIVDLDAEEVDTVLTETQKAFRNDLLHPYALDIFGSVAERCGDPLFAQILSLVEPDVIQTLADDTSEFPTAMCFVRRAVRGAKNIAQDFSPFFERVIAHITHYLDEESPSKLNKNAWGYICDLLVDENRAGIEFAVRWITYGSPGDFVTKALMKARVAPFFFGRGILNPAAWSECALMLSYGMKTADREEAGELACAIARIAVEPGGIALPGEVRERLLELAETAESAKEREELTAVFSEIAVRETASFPFLALLPQTRHWRDGVGFEKEKKESKNAQ
jgi:hypothetical protein